MFIPRALAAAAATLSSGILVPLYIYPNGPDCSLWQPLVNTIAAHPNVPFWLIINPDSGPEGTGSQAPKDFQQCIPKLRAPNVVVLGYVFTHRGASDRQAGVISDVDTYAGWNAAYKPDGIFFDEVSGEQGDFGTYQKFVAHARPLFGGGDGFEITLNPGTSPTDSRYYGITDLLLSAENFYNDFSPSNLQLGASTPPSKQAIVLTDGPSSPPTSLISQVVSQDHIRAFYITTDSQANGGNPYNDLPTDLEEFVAAIASAQGA
ncbi:Spherulation-specific family 4 [Trametes elegans]|nr:Spherulation-specific family 4 [Trametes elegans]